jgi:hypothetical protein
VLGWVWLNGAAHGQQAPQKTGKMANVILCVLYQDFCFVLFAVPEFELGPTP